MTAADAARAAMALPPGDFREFLDSFETLPAPCREAIGGFAGFLEAAGADDGELDSAIIPRFLEAYREITARRGGKAPGKED